MELVGKSWSSAHVANIRNACGSGSFPQGRRLGSPAPQPVLDAPTTTSHNQWSVWATPTTHCVRSDNSFSVATTALLTILCLWLQQTKPEVSY